MHLRSAAATTALLLASALTLTGCSSSGDTKADAAPAKPKPPAASPAPDPADATTPPATADPNAKPTGPVLPDAQLTPKTGSFKANEKQYLSGRVPNKTDPAAVLQTGQETCQRVERTAKHDKDAAAAAIASGELTGARDAITYLCPDQKPILATAERGFPDGSSKDPASGIYRAVTQSTTCTWEAKDTDGIALAWGPDAPPKPGDRITAAIPAGTATFTSTNCYAWLPA
ncbi:hypothetical protein BX286_5040 [Streptomyces sp. 3211.6]|uniref:hypothetical protein n=1 Tax=Streptomyces sp. 3211.6 TaxID=1938845 RepID=UPI000EB1E4F9|nr:hypothetical protein [Streptomyces sp. 3211.6]RKT06992.1 hypothetical protein BX286_5040 [Streptomyces sp. 3211.6]